MPTKKTSLNNARPPIVTIMGHVDHGKTSILDRVRKSNLASKEAGAITQHIGAYQVVYKTTQGEEKKITFIDTPGHEAFSAMRARGGHAADIVVLVVAADDSVKAQTKEAIIHAKESGVPIIIAINKIDLPNADPEKVKQDLLKEGIQVESLGGQVVCVELSAKTDKGIAELLELINVVAELEELTCDLGASLSMVVIEANVSAQKGHTAAVVVLNGKLTTGLSLYSGEKYLGKVRAVYNDWGKKITQALPGDPVEILGFKELPIIGSLLTNEPSSELVTTPEIVTTEPDERAHLSLVVKADTQGTLEAVVASLQRLDDDEASVALIFQGVGEVTEADVLLASAAKAMIVGFNVVFPANVISLAESMGVSHRTYTIIYQLLEDITKRLAGLEIDDGYVGKGLAVVVAIFPLTSGDTVAGSLVTHGQFKEGDKVRVLREGEEVARGVVKQIKVGQDRVTKVTKGGECGVLLKPGFALLVQDVLEVV